LVAASGNSRLIRAAQTLLTQSQRFRLFTLRLRERPVKSTRNHADLVKALKAGDVERARKIHAAQKVGWRDDMLALLAKFKITQI
ncbi:MAG TPA: FCD domain-containing protein, partial [Pseudolabrys sp.]|nr:FCD domain-containing protein [Pseudolabrys sp.]